MSIIVPRSANCAKGTGLLRTTMQAQQHMGTYFHRTPSAHGSLRPETHGTPYCGGLYCGDN
eukprot:4283908-Amphidinium_carterae.3